MTTTAMIVGGSRGLGRGIAQQLHDEGRTVVTVSRTAAPADSQTDSPSGPPADSLVGAPADSLVSAPADSLVGAPVAEAGDATEPAVAVRLLARYRPDVLVIAAGAVPPVGALSEFTWEQFAVPWEQDVRIAFTWLGAVLRRPLAPGSTVVVLGSGASLQGSPLSGGYAGAKATVRLITAYARGEAQGSGVTFTTILPGLAPETAVGGVAVRAYAGRQAISEAEFTARLAAPLTPRIAGAAIAGLLSEPAEKIAEAYTLDGAGLHEL